MQREKEMKGKEWKVSTPTYRVIYAIYGTKKYCWEWLPPYDGVYSESNGVPGGGGEDSQDRDGGYGGTEANQTAGEDFEPGRDETQPVHVVASVEMEAEEAHPEAGGQQHDVSDSQADEVLHPDGWLRTELCRCRNLSRYMYYLYYVINTYTLVDKAGYW